MIQELALVTTLRDTLTDEVFKALGVSPQGWARRTFGPLFHPPTTRFARIAARFDDHVARFGFAEACRLILPTFVREVAARGQEYIPPEGPLLITANHPGTYDALTIAAHLPRNDVKVIAGAIPFLKYLPHANPHFIYVPKDELHARMITIRNAIRHLADGGALIIFPSGHIDPEPEFQPQATAGLDEWSPSLEIFLRKVPQAQVLVTIVSNVLHRFYTNLPLTRLRREPVDRARIAEFCQVIRQMVMDKAIDLTPKVSFSSPITLKDLGKEGRAADILPMLKERARLLLNEHLNLDIPPTPLP
jgi:hypothetical protein